MRYVGSFRDCIEASDTDRRRQIALGLPAFPGGLTVAEWAAHLGTTVEAVLDHHGIPLEEYRPVPREQWNQARYWWTR